MTVADFGKQVLSTMRGIAALVAGAGFHTISPWWWATLTTWLVGMWRQLVLRVGRRGGKSSTLCLLAVAWAMVYPAKAIPLGDVGVIAFISVDRREVDGRLRTVESLLTALKIEFQRKGDAIELSGRPIRFQAFTGSVAGVSGFTCILAICDEVAKWRDSDSGTNPATEVLASLRPTMATQPLARIILSSSAVSNLDAHAKAFDGGNTDFQMIAAATTWEANPNITEAATRALEPDERIWRSEYGNVPRSAVSGAFDPDHIDRCFRAFETVEQLSRPVTFIDASGGKGDSFVWGVGSWVVTERDQDPHVLDDVVDGAGNVLARACVVRRDETGRPVPNPHYGTDHRAFVFHHLDGIDGRFFETTRADEIARRIARQARGHQANRVFGDQFAALAMHALLSQVGQRLTEQPLTSESKQRAVIRLRDWMRERRLILPGNAEGQKLRRELHAFEEQITASGNVRYAGRRNTHDDRVSLLIQAALADMNGELRGSPLAVSRARIEYGQGLAAPWHQ